MYRCDQTSQNTKTRCAFVLSCIKLLLTGFEWLIIKKNFLFTTMRTPPCHAQRPPRLPQRPNAPWRFQTPPWGAITPPLRNTALDEELGCSCMLRNRFPEFHFSNTCEKCCPFCFKLFLAKTPKSLPRIVHWAGETSDKCPWKSQQREKMHVFSSPKKSSFTSVLVSAFQNQDPKYYLRVPVLFLSSAYLWLSTWVNKNLA